MEKDNEKASALQRMQSAIRAINRMDLPDEEKARRIQGVMQSMSARSRESSTGRSSGTSDEEGEGSVAWKTFRDDEEQIMGCKHYMRSCRIRAACCNRLYTCRICHNENEDHQINRYATESMVCMHCAKEQPCGRECRGCGEVLGLYYCDTCRFHDSDPAKKIFHCDQCGLCRIGEREQYFHCETCEICLHVSMRGNHRCQQSTMKRNCPVCHEDLFTSRVSSTIMRCGHGIHQKCMKKWLSHSMSVRIIPSCPLCNKAIYESEEMDREIDSLVSSQEMPEIYRNVKAEVLCNECQAKTIVPFHFIQMRCGDCRSYNTRVLDRIGMPSVDALRQWAEENRASETAGGEGHEDMVAMVEEDEWEREEEDEDEDEDDDDDDDEDEEDEDEEDEDDEAPEPPDVD